MIWRCGLLFIFCPRRQKTNQKNAAWGWEGFNQTKAPKTKNFKIAWLSLDFNISPSPRPLPLCGHSPAKRVRHTIKGMSICHLRSVAVILWKAFAFVGKVLFSESFVFLLSAQACADKKRDIALQENQNLVSLAVAGATEGG